MIEPATLCGLLRDRGYTFYAAVPCSMFNGPINHVLAAPDLDFVMAANEGAALAVASGAWLAGRKAVVMLQNSGVGNLLNPLTSLAAPCRIPVLLLISGRGYPDGSWDEPQHRVMGAKLRALLDELGVRRFDFPGEPEAAAAMLEEADDIVSRREQSVAMIVPKGCFAASSVAPPWERDYEVTRDDAIDIVFEQIRRHCRDGAAVISTTGKISRAVFSLHDRDGNFYMQGAMGHARGISLGVALSDPARRVVLLDGDGATLMHMGTISTVGHYLPPSLIEVVLDNEAHGSTGNQYTTSSTTDIAAVAKACGYRQTSFCITAEELRASMDAALTTAGPALILMKINRDEPREVPRVTSAHAPDAMARFFREFLSKGR